MAEIATKNKVMLFYYHRVKGKTIYGGVIEVSTTTGKVKKIISTSENEFVPQYYDGKYVYRNIISNGKVNFYRKSVKTKKTEKFSANNITYDNKKYIYSEPMYSFYNGKILGIEPGGKVFYGTFDSKKFEQVGDISTCKYFKEYEPQTLVMKSKNEFYIPYCPCLAKDEEPDGYIDYRGDFIVKYEK